MISRPAKVTSGGGLKGRGSTRNPHNRFAPCISEAVDDGWREGAAIPDDVPDSIATEVRDEQAKTIIARNRSPDVPFDRSINPYRGCEHGCIYCFARPTHAYWDLSPGLDFETRLIAKPNAVDCLERELGKRGYRCRPIAMGTNTDPYQPVEKERRITRAILETLEKWRHPVSIVTKGALVLRDIDILARMARDNLCHVALSITTLDNDLKRRMEPRAASPAARLRTLRALSDAGIPTGVMFAPVIPALNDHETEAVLAASREAGAIRAGYVLLRLPLEVEELFVDWLDKQFPDRAAHVMNLLRQYHEGKAYRSDFNRRQSGTGVFAQLLQNRFNQACRRHGLNPAGSRPLNTNLFEAPATACQQRALF